MSYSPLFDQHVIAQFLENASVREVGASLLLAAVHDPGFLIGLLVAESVLRDQAGSCSHHLVILLARIASSEASMVSLLRPGLTQKKLC